MKSNKKIIEAIIAIQNERNIENNELLIFFYGMIEGQVMSFKSLLFNIISNERIREYEELLIDKELITKKEILFLDKVAKSKTKIITMESNSNEIELVIDNINSLNGTNLKVTKMRSSYIMKLIKQKYTIEDLIMVNEYFYHKWVNNPEMVKYIRIETLYNNKFEARYEEAKKAYESFFEFKNDIEYIYETYNDIYDQEIGINLKVKPKYRFIRFNEQENIVFWLRKGFSKEDIIETIAIAVNSWKTKIELIPFITLSKLLDEQFETRKKAAEVKKNKCISGSKMETLAILEKWI